MNTLKQNLFLIVAVFIGCVFNVKCSRLSDCMMQKMLYGRPCNQSPTVLQRPTFIQMKFADNDDQADEHQGNDLPAHFPIHEFNKMRLQFEDINKRFDNLEKMIEALILQISVKSEKACSCNLTSELQTMRKEIIEHCNSSHSGNEPAKNTMTTITATTTIIPSSVSFTTPTPIITTTESPTPAALISEVDTYNLKHGNSDAHAMEKSETTLATAQFTTEIIENSVTMAADEAPSDDRTLKDSYTDNVSTNPESITENFVFVQDAIPFAKNTSEKFANDTENSSTEAVLAGINYDNRTSILTSAPPESQFQETVDVTSSSSLDFLANHSIAKDYDNVTSVQSQGDITSNTDPLITEAPHAIETTEEDSGVWVYVRKPVGKQNESDYWKIENLVTLPPDPKHKNFNIDVDVGKLSLPLRKRKGNHNHTHTKSDHTHDHRHGNRHNHASGARKIYRSISSVNP